MLPETLTFFGTGLDYASCAEAIPGPATEYFGQLAKKHNLYIVAGLIERDHAERPRRKVPRPAFSFRMTLW